MQRKTRIALACSIGLLVAGCAKSDQAATDSAAAAAMTAAEPAATPAPTLSIADVAGTWQVRGVPESGSDTSATTYVLVVSADSSTAIMTFPSGLKVPVQLSVSGDSVHSKTGEFASQRRKGMTVSSVGHWQLQNGKLVGTTIATYKTTGADSVLRLRSEGTKAP